MLLSRGWFGHKFTSNVRGVALRVAATLNSRSPRREIMSRQKGYAKGKITAVSGYHITVDLGHDIQVSEKDVKGNIITRFISRLTASDVPKEGTVVRLHWKAK
jgi:hypothetical protein